MSPAPSPAVGPQPPRHRLIGLFGGTFDPIHVGHLRLAEEMREALAIDEVRFVPAGEPWQREPTGASARQRLAMVEAAVAGHPHFRADAQEVERTGPSYTIDTVRATRDAQPDAAVCLLIGADAFVRLDTWNHWRELLAEAHFAVARRPGYAMQSDRMQPELAEQVRARLTEDPGRLHATRGGAIFALEMTLLDISATNIRALLAARRSARYLLPDAVLDYIEIQGLYSAEANEARGIEGHGGPRAGGHQGA